MVQYLKVFVKLTNIIKKDDEWKIFRYGGDDARERRGKEGVHLFLMLFGRKERGEEGFKK